MLTADTTVTWSLLGESNSDYGLTDAACSPLPLSRHELGKRDSDAHLGVSRTPGLPVTTFPTRAPAGCYPRHSRSYKERPDVGSRGRSVPGTIRTRTADLPRDRDSCRLVYEDMEPSSGADPDLLPYEGKVTAVCDGMGWPSRLRTRKLRVQSPAGLPIPLMAISAEGAIRTHKREV